MTREPTVVSGLFEDQAVVTLLGDDGELLPPITTHLRAGETTTLALDLR